MSNNYQKIEKAFSQLLASLGSCFSESERREAQEFIDAKEYGLALETLVDIIDEEDKHISRDTFCFIIELGQLMSINKKLFEEKLRGHIAGNE